MQSQNTKFVNIFFIYLIIEDEGLYKESNQVYAIIYYSILRVLLETTDAKTWNLF